MGPETVATLIVVAVIVLLIAYHLIAIASGLKTVTSALDVIADALGEHQAPDRPGQPGHRRNRR